MGSLAWAEPTRLTSIGRYASPTWVPLSLPAPLPRTKSVFHLSSSLRHLSSAASCSQAGDSLIQRLEECRPRAKINANSRPHP